MSETRQHILRQQEPLAVVIEKLGSSGLPALPVVDDVNRLQGMVVLDEVHLAAQAKQAGAWLLAADLMRPGVQPLIADDRLDRAMELFVEQDLLALPVVDGNDERHVLGVVRRSDVAQAYLRHVHGRQETQAGEG